MTPARPQFGDLVRVRLFDSKTYYGIVRRAGDPYCDVLIGNGLTMEFNVADLERIPIHQSSESPCNFAEAMQSYPADSFSLNRDLCS